LLGFRHGSHVSAEYGPKRINPAAAHIAAMMSQPKKGTEITRPLLRIPLGATPIKLLPEKYAPLGVIRLPRM